MFRSKTARTTICRLGLLPLLPLLTCGCFAQLADVARESRKTQEKTGEKTGRKTEMSQSPAKTEPAESKTAQPERTVKRNPRPVAEKKKTTPIRPPQPVAKTGQRNRPATIRLSAGAALPQSLPQGTVMSFTAEYQFRNSGPNSSVQYVWVIEGRSKTKRYAIRRLASRGQLPALFSRDFRPGDGPFRSYIEEWPASKGKRRPGEGKRVSNIVPMR